MLLKHQLKLNIWWFLYRLPLERCFTLSPASLCTVIVLSRWIFVVVFFVYSRNLHSFAVTTDCPFITWPMLTVLYELGLMGHTCDSDKSSYAITHCMICLPISGLNCVTSLEPVHGSLVEKWCLFWVFSWFLCFLSFGENGRYFCLPTVHKLFTASLPQNYKSFHV